MTASYLYFCSFLLREGEFFDIVCAANRFDESRARLYFIQLAQGVAYLHAHLICHLDLSLENMLMDDNDVCKVGNSAHGAGEHDADELEDESKMNEERPWPVRSVDVSHARARLRLKPAEPLARAGQSCKH